MGRAQSAAPRPRDVPFSRRLVEQNMDELAHLLSSEHGKVIADSKGDIQRGLEVIEFACAFPISPRVNSRKAPARHRCLFDAPTPGRRRGITPFNFPAMIPMWMFGVAIACGNCFIFKRAKKTRAYRCAWRS